jgi:ketosteroid isomerase-like protein
MPVKILFLKFKTTIDMQNNHLFRVLLVIAAFSTFGVGCKEKAKEESVKEVATVAETVTRPDLAQIRTEIQALENEWADALNKKDINKLMTFYADDVVSMPNESPMITGKEAVRKQQEMELANTKNPASFSFETIDVFSEGIQVLELGKTTRKDATGKVASTGKYMALFEKRDGKYVCIREMYNEDQKRK